MSFLSFLRRHDAVTKAISLGIVSLAMYLVLFRYEKEAIEITTQYGWSFVMPVVIALLFSFVHGAFTGAFWDALGLKAKTTVKK